MFTLKVRDKRSWNPFPLEVLLEGRPGISLLYKENGKIRPIGVKNHLFPLWKNNIFPDLEYNGEEFAHIPIRTS